jgi:hypothetical protein
MVCIPHPIHETQACLGKDAIPKVILDHDCFRYPLTFSEQGEGVAGMMKNVDEHDRVEACVGIWDAYSVKLLDRYLGVLSHEDVNSLNRNVCSLLRDKVIDHSVPATYI